MAGAAGRSMIRDRLPASRLLTGTARMAYRGRLRIIAYHDVPDAAALQAQLRFLLKWFRPVDAAQVESWLAGRTRLPDNAVWMTFDDGRPSALAAAEQLAELGIRATAFLCPGMIGTDEPFWWEVVDRAVSLGVAPPPPLEAPGPAALVATVKRYPDRLRRQYVDSCAVAAREATGQAVTGQQASWGQVQKWVEAGHDVGNHSWDHPTLDTCSTHETVTQVMRAHDALRQRFPTAPLVFAYPNGDLSPAAEAALIDLGYHVRVLFDHALASRRSGPLSRLRLDADAAVPRCRAIVSGAHPWLYRLQRWWPRR